MADFHLDIQYKPGKLNIVADALSRRPDYLLANLSSVEGSADPLLKLRDFWSQSPPSSENCIERDGLFYLEGKFGELRMMIPNSSEMDSLKKCIISELHDSAYSGHLGLNKTLELVQRNYEWAGMHEQVQHYVATCPSCQQNKHSTRKKSGLLQPLPVPEKKWDHISMDLITQLPLTGEGNDAIIVFVDRLSKMVHMAPTKTTIDAPGCAKLLMRTVVKYHGMPKAIVSDRDPRFTGHFWQHLMKALGTKLQMSTAHHPQTDGLTERANQTIEMMLRAFVNADHTDWDQHLDMVEFAYNNSAQASSGHSPFFLNFGEHPNTPIKLALESNAAKKVPATLDFLGKIDKAMSSAKEKTLAAQARQKRFADEHRREANFFIGQKVWLSTENLRMIDGQARKLSKRWAGPWPVVDRVGPVSYRLKLPRRMKIHPVFHVSSLKESREDPERPLDLVQPGPVHEFKDGSIYFIAEEIVGKKILKNGQVRYHVKWKDWPSWENSWEPKSHLKNVPELIEAYEKAHPSRRKHTRKN